MYVDYLQHIHSNEDDCSTDESMMEQSNEYIRDSVRSIII